jgi:predicted AlkP superfamily pyrophosphatase or phosphodiesterase
MNTSLLPVARSLAAIGTTCALVLPLRTAAQTARPSWQEPPRLVVGVVVDQMRTDYIYRLWDQFGEGGFKRLVNEGSFQRSAHYDYAATHTGPGHASVYTGTTPRDHGIILNDMFMRSTGRVVNCVQDDDVRPVGAEGHAQPPLAPQPAGRHHRR